MTTVGVGDQQPELDAVGQLLGLQTGGAGELLRSQGWDGDLAVLPRRRRRRDGAWRPGARRQGLAAVECLEVLLDHP